MKILVLSASYPPMTTGGADYAMHFCRQLAERGHEVRIVTSEADNITQDPGLTVLPIMKDWSWRELGKLLRVAREFKPDVINLHFLGAIYHDHPMITLAPAILKKKLPGVRFITLIEYPSAIDTKWSWPTRVARAAIARWVGRDDLPFNYGAILRDSDKVIVLSGTHATTLEKVLPRVRERCVLIPPPPLLKMAVSQNGEARHHGRELLGVSDDDLLLTFFGFLFPGKGIETLLAAFQEVSPDYPNLKLVLAGGSGKGLKAKWHRDDYGDTLKALAAKLGVAERVIWTGYTPSSSDVLSYCLHASDVGVLPFDCGVFLNNSSFAASAAHGLPTITTRGEVLEDPFVHGENVYICPPKDPKALADAIRALIDDAALRDKLRAGAKAMARELFSWDTATDRVEESFR